MTSPPDRVTVTNGGNSAGLLTAASPAGQAAVAVGGCAGTVLAAGASCDLELTYTPRLAWGVTAFVNLCAAPPTASSARPRPAASPPSPPRACRSPCTWASAAAPRTATFTNVSANPVTAGRPAFIRATAANTPLWSAVNDGCNGVTVPPAGTRTVSATVVADLDRQHGQRRPAQRRQLPRHRCLGDRGQRRQQPDHVVRAQRRRRHLGAQDDHLHQPESPRRWPSSRCGSRPPIGLAGDPTAVATYALANATCSGHTLAPAGTQATLQAAVIEGRRSRNAVLTVTSGGTTVGTSNLSGSGSLALQAPAANFGDVAIGSTNGPQTVTFTNNGPNPVQVTHVKLAGDATSVPSWALRRRHLLGHHGGCGRWHLHGGADLRPAGPGRLQGRVAPARPVQRRRRLGLRVGYRAVATPNVRTTEEGVAGSAPPSSALAVLVLVLGIVTAVLLGGDGDDDGASGPSGSSVPAGSNDGEGGAATVPGGRRRLRMGRAVPTRRPAATAPPSPTRWCSSPSCSTTPSPTPPACSLEVAASDRTRFETVVVAGCEVVRSAQIEGRGDVAAIADEMVATVPTDTGIAQYTAGAIMVLSRYVAAGGCGSSVTVDGVSVALNQLVAGHLVG